MMSVKAMPFSLPVLRKRVRVGTEVVKGKTLTGRGPSAQLNGEGRKPREARVQPCLKRLAVVNALVCVG